MVLAASGSKSAAGATMKSASQSNTKSTSSSNPRGPTGPSNSQPRSSPAGGTPGSVSRSSSFGSGADRRGGGGGGNSTTSRIGSAASAQRASSISSGNVGVKGGPPNAAAARASAALNAGLGRPSTPPVSGALNTQRSIAAPPALPNTQPPVQVRNYLGSGTATPFGGYQYTPGQMYSDPYRSRSALGSVLNNAKLSGMSPMQTSDAVLRSAGLANPVGRAGVLGTFDHESAGFNPNAVGDQGTAFGLAQWRGPRVAGLQKYAAGMGQPTGTVGVQTAYALTEMGRSFPKTLNSLQAAQDVRGAVTAMNDYERPRGYTRGGDPTAVAGWADRLARANAALSNVTKDQSRVPSGEAPATFAKAQSRVLPSIPIRTATMGNPLPSNVVQQSTDTGPQERILSVEDVPPLATSAQGGLGVFGVSSPVASQRPLSVPIESTTVQRDAFYGGGPTPSTYQGYGTFNGPSIVTTPDPNASLPNYGGFRQVVQPASPPIPRLRPEPQNFPVKPYGAKTKALINAPLGLIPFAGEVNTGLASVGYSVGDYIVNEENKLANMTPEQRERYRSYWSEKRSNAPGRGAENRGQQQFTPVNTSSGPLSDPAVTQPTSSNTWEADAVAYGYSQAQLKDPEVRGLIKQLWDMGFIPKTSAPP